MNSTFLRTAQAPHYCVTISAGCNRRDPGTHYNRVGRSDRCNVRLGGLPPCCMPSAVLDLRDCSSCPSLACDRRSWPGRVRSAQIATGGAPTTLDLTVTDGDRNREIPIRVFLPAAKTPQPVVLFSHGLGGSREGSRFSASTGRRADMWSVYLQHPGSDTSVWRNEPLGKRMDAMRSAASGQNLLLRVKDVPAVLDQLQKWNAESQHPLAGRLDLGRVGMSGHSFGAVTTQAVSGQSLAGRWITFTDPRIKAAIAFSPSGPRGSRDPKKAFGDVKIPWMLMTGTKDVSPIGDIDVPSRLACTRRCRRAESTNWSSTVPSTPPSPTAHCRVIEKHAIRITIVSILALSTAFWDANLRDDKAAEEWLDGDGPRKVLEPNDRWQHK